MKRLPLFFAMCSLLLACIAIAQEPTPDPNQYNDPAMSFTPPAEYQRIPMDAQNPAQFDHATVVARWVRNLGRRDQKVITITMENFPGNYEGYEGYTESQMRDQISSIFFKNKLRTTLSNGMPAYWLDVTLGSGFDQVKSYEYLWSDSVRGVTLSISAGAGQLGDTEAKKALANVSAVLYPKGRV